jgi:lipoprotein NlpI
MPSLRLFVACALRHSAAQSPSELVYRGAEAFEAAGACSKQCSFSYVNESVRLFDQAGALGYPFSELWQRGISLYYVERFDDGSEQFRRDVAANPNDTEESIWAFACEAQSAGFEKARDQMLVVANETRPYMSTIYSLFRGDGTVNEFDVASKVVDPDSPTVDAAYYAFYLGLFEEARGNMEKARAWIERLASSKYAKSSVCTVDDYVDCVGVFARVQAQLRGWLNTTADELEEQGEDAFKAGDVKRSLQLFDQAIKSGYEETIFWQRGISLYYVGEYKDCSKQFHDNYKVLGKHHDAEESVWAFICEAQINGFKKAQEQMLVIVNETRPYMQTVYELFRGRVRIDQAEKIALESPLQDAFYYSLYLGLFEEAAGNVSDARAWISRAARSEYVTTGDDYMGAVAIVHAKVRG